MASEHDRASRLLHAVDTLKTELADIQAALKDVDNVHHAGVVAARDRYLTSGSANRVPRFEANLEKIRRHFTGEGSDGWKWDVGSIDWGLLRQGRLKQFAAFGRTDYGTKIIKMAPKSFLLNPLILRGVMLHEVTHAQFSTDDIAYDYGVYPSSSHDKLARLADDEKMENADSWRIFYQEAIRAMV